VVETYLSSLQRTMSLRFGNEREAPHFVGASLLSPLDSVAVSPQKDRGSSSVVAEDGMMTKMCCCIVDAGISLSIRLWADFPTSCGSVDGAFCFHCLVFASRLVVRAA